MQKSMRRFLCLGCCRLSRLRLDAGHPAGLLAQPKIRHRNYRRYTSTDPSRDSIQIEHSQEHNVDTSTHYFHDGQLPVCNDESSNDDSIADYYLEAGAESVISPLTTPISRPFELSDREHKTIRQPTIAIRKCKKLEIARAEAEFIAQKNGPETEKDMLSAPHLPDVNVEHNKLFSLRDRDFWWDLQYAIRQQYRTKIHKEKIESKAQEMLRRNIKNSPDFDKSWSLEEGLIMTDLITDGAIIDYFKLTNLSHGDLSVSATVDEPRRLPAHFRFKLEDPQYSFRTKGRSIRTDILEYIKIYRRECGPSPRSNKVLDDLWKRPIRSPEEWVAVELLRNIGLPEYSAETGRPRSHYQYVPEMDIWKQTMPKWVSVLSRETDDECINQLLTCEDDPPFFVLYSLLRPSDHNFMERVSLPKVLAIFERMYIEKVPQSLVDNPRHYVNNITFVAQHLAFHCRRLWPAFAENCTQVFARLLEVGLPQVFRDTEKLFAARSALFNCFVQYIARPAPWKSFHHSIFNWHALRTLLAYSDRQTRTLHLDRATYQNIRLLLLIMEHSPDEKDLYGRLIPTWPPYPEKRGGFDDKLTLDDTLSRVLQVGRLATEAGFPKTTLDVIVDALGGLNYNGTPTIRTRSMLWPLLQREKVHIQHLWAAQVRSCRNATEAWALFNHAPREGIKPGPLVYEALLEKFTARDNVSGMIVPGEARELIPTWVPNLTEFERTRRKPPPVEHLYQRMMNAGVTVTLECLCLLIKHAPSVSAARRYLGTSDHLISEEQTTALCAPIDEKNADIIRTINKDIVAAYIRLLIKKQTLSHVDVHRFHKATFFRIHKAYWIAMKRFNDDPDKGVSVWRAICRRLAETPTLRLHPHIDEMTNTSRILPLFMRVFLHLVHNCGRELQVAADLFAMVENYMMPVIFEHRNIIPGSRVPPLLGIFTQDSPSEDMKIPEPDDYYGLRDMLLISYNAHSAERRIKLSWALRHFAIAFFDKITATGHYTNIPTINVSKTHTMSSKAIHKLMRALAFTGAFQEMNHLARWIALSWHPGSLMGHPAAEMRECNSIFSALCAFRLFAERFLPKEDVKVTKELIDERVEKEGGAEMVRYYWPSGEERELYRKGDLMGHAEILEGLLGRVRERGREVQRGEGAEEAVWEREKEKEM